jgi:hypothetical protein
MDKIIQFKKGKTGKTKVQDGSLEIVQGRKIYKNDYLGFEIKVPEQWITLEHNDLIQIAQENVNRLPISEEEKSKIVESMTTKSISLFSATPFPKGTKQPFGKSQTLDNPSINCTAQKVIMYPNSTSSDFTEGMIELLKNGSMGFKYEEVSNVNTVIISGKRFDSIEGKAFINDGRDIVYTKYYSILNKGYQLSIIISCISEEGLEALGEIVGSLKLD